MPKAKETGAASAPAKKTAGRRSYRSYGKIKPAPGKSKAEPKPIKVSFLGGLNEVGKNMTLFEYGEDMFLVDCGLAFPDQDMLGVDLVLPDFTYVERNADRIRGIVITHGHEDHIGGLPYLLKVLNVPVYGTKLTIGLIQGKLREHGLLNSASLNVINPGDVIPSAALPLRLSMSTIPYPTHSDSLSAARAALSSTRATSKSIQRLSTAA